MLCYDFHIEYIDTTKFGYVDVLSRLIDCTVKPEEAVDSIPITAMKTAAATDRDETLKHSSCTLRGQSKLRTKSTRS